jgi:hypothetical protein
MKLLTGGLALAILALLVLSRAPAQAQDAFEKVLVPYYGVLSFPRGVRSIGMGMAGVADDADPANVFYNPAVAARRPGMAITGGYNTWKDDFRVADVGATATYEPASERFQKWRIGGGIRYTQLDYAPEQGDRKWPASPGYVGSIDLSFTDWYIASTIAAAYTIRGVDVAAGFAVKRLEAGIGDNHRFVNWSYDAGLLVKRGFCTSDGRKVTPSFGVSALSFGADTERGSDTIDPVSQMRYGLGIRLEEMGVQQAGMAVRCTAPVLAIALDAEILDYNVPQELERKLGSSVGVEFSLADILSIRYGYTDGQEFFVYGQTFGGSLGYGWGRTSVHLEYGAAFGTSGDNISAIGFTVGMDL